MKGYGRRKRRYRTRIAGDGAHRRGHDEEDRSVFDVGNPSRRSDVLRPQPSTTKPAEAIKTDERDRGLWRLWWRSS